MTDTNSDFLSFLSENDPLGLLKQPKANKPKAKRSVLLNNFEEIVDFSKSIIVSLRIRQLTLRNFSCTIGLKL